jgi:osmotically-inducible protein OsmY
MTDSSEPPIYLAQRIHEALATGPTAELGVEVSVGPAGVVLAGTVGTDEQRGQLAEVAQSLAGDLPVRNDVVVVHGRPDPEPEALT